MSVRLRNVPQPDRTTIAAVASPPGMGAVSLVRISGPDAIQVADRATGGKAATRFRATLVTVQIALSMALLVSAGLFLKSLMNVSRVDLGLRVDDVVTFGLSPVRAGMDTTRAAVYSARVQGVGRACAGLHEWPGHRRGLTL